MEQAHGARNRGRRPGNASTREEIVEEARRQFGEFGYRRTTLRGIARGAGVDPRMILHFFGSKQALFTSTIELPFEPEVAFEILFAEGAAGIGQRVAEFILSILDDPRGRSTVTGIIRAAVSEPEAAALVRELLTQRLLTPLARQVGSDHPDLRASLIGAQVVGLIMARHVVALKPLSAASHDDLVQALTPVFEYYLLGDLPAITTQVQAETPH